MLGTVRDTEVCETLPVHKFMHLKFLGLNGRALNLSSQLKWAVKVKWREKKKERKKTSMEVEMEIRAT